VPYPLPVAARHLRGDTRFDPRGSTVAGVVVAAVALTVSLPVCIATIAFFMSTGCSRTTYWCPASSAAPWKYPHSSRSSPSYSVVLCSASSEHSSQSPLPPPCNYWSENYCYPDLTSSESGRVLAG